MGERISVLHLIWALPRGGAERQAVELVRGLHGERFTVAVGCLSEMGPLADELSAAGIEVFPLHKRPGLDFGLSRRLAQALRAREVKILHAHMFTAALWGRLAARRAGVPGVISHEHSTFTLDRSWRRFIDRRLGRWTSRIVAVADDLAARFRNAGYPRQKVITIRNGISLEGLERREARSITRARLGLPDQALVLLIVGWLEPRKDHRTLFRALPLISRAREVGGRELILLVAGNGPLRRELEAAAPELSGGARIRFLGDVPEVRDLLWAADVYVSSSITEGTSIALLEAMAAKTPVVATAVGGTPEVLAQGEAGWLCPPREPPALAAAICRCLGESAATEAKLGRARQRVAAEYSLDGMIERFRELYEELLREQEK